MENVFRIILHHIRETELLSSSDQAKMDHTILRLVRLSDSFIAEAAIVVIAYVQFATKIEPSQAIAHAWGLNDIGTGLHFSAAGLYYAVVSQLLYHFLLGVSLWKWLLWIRFLFGLSRLDLHLVPTHPDHHGGLGFLGMSPLAIAPTVLVVSAAIGYLANSDPESGAHLKDFKIEAIVLLVVVLLVAMGPLVFSPQSLGAFVARASCNMERLASYTAENFTKNGYSAARDTKRNFWLRRRSALLSTMPAAMRMSRSCGLFRSIVARLPQLWWQPRSRCFPLLLPKFHL